MSVVYVVTEGEYSDYRIIAVFSTEQLAKEFTGESKDTQIEPFDLDEVMVKRYRRYWDCEINLTTGDLLSDESTSVELEDISKRGSIYFDSKYHSFRSKIAYAGPWARCTSFVSQEHSRKLAAEARQKWLRSGSPLHFSYEEGSKLKEGIEI